MKRLRRWIWAYCHLKVRLHPRFGGGDLEIRTIFFALRIAHLAAWYDENGCIMNGFGSGMSVAWSPTWRVDEAGLLYRKSRQWLMRWVRGDFMWLPGGERKEIF